MDRGLPESLREWHAHRRWVEAVNAWYKANPDADYRLEDLLGRRERRRAATRSPAVVAVRSRDSGA